MVQTGERTFSGKHPVFRICLYAVSLAVLGFTLWQGYVLVKGKFRSVIRDKQDAGTLRRSKDSAAETVGAGIDAAREGRSVGGVFSIDVDPPVDPPSGSKRIWACGRKARRKGWVDLQWVYDCRGNIEEIKSDFHGLMDAQGYTCLGTVRGGTQRQTMTFKRGQVILRIILRTSAKNDTIVRRIVVIHNRPRSGDQRD